MVQGQEFELCFLGSTLVLGRALKPSLLNSNLDLEATGSQADYGHYFGRGHEGALLSIRERLHRQQGPWRLFRGLRRTLVWSL